MYKTCNASACKRTSSNVNCENVSASDSFRMRFTFVRALVRMSAK